MHQTSKKSSSTAYRLITRGWLQQQFGILLGDENKGESTEMQAVKHYLAKYLKENVEASETVMNMQDVIGEFRQRSPRVIVLKCIDGRVHGSKGKGYPPTTIDFFRTEGSKLNTDIGNITFWGKMDRVATDAARNTPEMPPLFIALAHTGHEGHGCAAQSAPGLERDQVIANSLATVDAHAKAARAQYSAGQVYAFHGITNTDDMSERLIFPDGTAMDTADIIAKVSALHIPCAKPADVFVESFLNAPLPDVALRRYTGERTVRVLMEGNEAPVYRELGTAIALESFLLREISEAAQSGRNAIVHPVIFEAILSTLQSVPGLPITLFGPLLYQTIWNIAYTLYQRNWVKTMNEEQKEEHLEHAETLVCYGEGFELLPRNRAVLAKTGRGDDRDALRVAKKVLEGNRKKRPQNHQPIVHINVEVTDTFEHWNSFNAQALARLAAMTREVYDVFGPEVSIITTYSRPDEKRFYPVQTFPVTPAHPRDPRLCFPIDISAGLKDDVTFVDELQRREREYSDELLLTA